MQPTHDNGHKTKNNQDTKYIKFNLQILVQAVEWVTGGCQVQHSNQHRWLQTCWVYGAISIAV